MVVFVEVGFYLSSDLSNGFDTTGKYIREHDNWQEFSGNKPLLLIDTLSHLYYKCLRRFI